MDLDPTLLTAIAVTASLFGLLLDKVRNLLSSIFRRPSKNTVLVTYDDDAFMSVELDGDVYRALRAAGLERGLTDDQSKRIAQAVLRQLADQRGLKRSTAEETGEVPDAR